MDKPPDGPLPREVEEVLKELSAQNFIFGNRNLQLNEAFSKRLEEVSKSVLDSPHLSPTLASELRAGFGQNLGARLVDWVWDSLSPTFKQSPGPNPVSDLIIECPKKWTSKLHSFIKRFAQEYFQETGVHLPAPEFREDPAIRVLFRRMALGVTAATAESDLVEDTLQDALYWGASRFLTPHQVKQRLHDLWTQRPELLQMYLEEGVGLTSVLDVMRYLLDRQYSIWEFDLIVEEVIFQYRLKSEESVAERVARSLAELLRQNRFGKIDEHEEEERGESFDPVRIEMGRGALFALEPERTDSLMERVRSLRRSIDKKYGWVPPGIRLQDNLTMEPEEFAVYVRERRVVAGKVWPQHLMAIGPDHLLSTLRGIESTDPAFGTPCRWIAVQSRARAEEIGCVIFTAESVIATTLANVLEDHAHEIFNLQNVREMLTALKERNKTLAKIMTKSPELLLAAKDLCCELLAERVPVLDGELIFEAVLRERHSKKPPFYLAEEVRRQISHLVVREHLDVRGKLRAVTLDAELEQWCLEALQEGSRSAVLRLTQERETALRQAVKELLDQAAESGPLPVLITAERLRKPLRQLLNPGFPRLTVLSEAEVSFPQMNHLGEAASNLPELNDSHGSVAKVRPTPAVNRRFRRPKKIRKHP